MERFDFLIWYQGMTIWVYNLTREERDAKYVNFTILASVKLKK